MTFWDTTSGHKAKGTAPSITLRGERGLEKGDSQWITFGRWDRAAVNLVSNATPGKLLTYDGLHVGFSECLRTSLELSRTGLIALLCCRWLVRWTRRWWPGERRWTQWKGWVTLYSGQHISEWNILEKKVIVMKFSSRHNQQIPLSWTSVQGKVNKCLDDKKSAGDKVI